MCGSTLWARKKSESETKKHTEHCGRVCVESPPPLPSSSLNSVAYRQFVWKYAAYEKSNNSSSNNNKNQEFNTIHLQSLSRRKGGERESPDSGNHYVYVCIIRMEITLWTFFPIGWIALNTKVKAKLNISNQWICCVCVCVCGVVWHCVFIIP